MVTNDATILRLKHDVLYEVAKAAWEGNLEEKRDEIPYDMIPGPQASYRCCIYKEREIIKQRVRLAEGKCPTGRDSSNVVQVINAACEECPIASYIVTDNCRKCMGKACQNSCNFGAITMGHDHAYIDPNKCKECGKCAQACPYNAIAHLERPCKKVCPVDAITYDEYGICVIDEKKCIQCGACIHSCPFGAIGSKTFMVDVIRLIKAQHPGAKTVFIGPCIAKKSESLDLNIEGNADYVMTFGEIRAMMRAKGVELQPATNEYQEGSVFGKRFGNGGGVTAAVLECMKEREENFDAKVLRCNGGAECKKALLLMKVGRLPEDFVEGMVCAGGCVGGPSKHKGETEAKKARDQLIGEADDRRILENLKKYPMDQFSMHRH